MQTRVVKKWVLTTSCLIVCAATVKVTWKDEFQIAATHDSFSAGSKSKSTQHPSHMRQHLVHASP